MVIEFLTEFLVKSRTKY